MLIEKEVIRPGTYWYRDQETGQPRKLVVTPELTRYWHEQGNAMLATGLTVPVPFEHDFSAHPMTPAEKLLNNAGWVRGYTLKGDTLFSAVDIADPKVRDKLPGTIRWTSPWINSFTDGNGKEWKNVISHLALTTRPRIVEQQPFGSVAAALSNSDYVTSWDQVGDAGICLSNAGLLNGDAPAYPMAFSGWVGIPLAWSPQARAKALESRRRNAAARKAAKSAPKAKSHEHAAHPHSEMAHGHSQELHRGSDPDGPAGFAPHHHSTEASGASAKAHGASKTGDHAAAHNHHHAAAQHHVEAAKSHHMRGDKDAAYKHAEAANAHFKAAKQHHDLYRSKKRGRLTLNPALSAAFGDGPPSKAKKPGVAKENDAAVDDEVAETGDDEIPDDGDPTNDDNIDLEPFGDPAGDVSMTELLCDLLGALGIHCESSGNEEMFKRELYNAAMTKIHELTAQGQNNGKPPNRTNPPGQPPNNPQKPGGNPGQPNPLVQQEPQPMYMSLEDIKKITDPTVRTIALSMYNENVRLRGQVEASERVSNGLRDKTLREATAKRAERVAMLGKLSPRAKANLDAMMAQPNMALSMGDGGEVVDPMAQTLAVLEAGLGDMPRLLTTDSATLSVQAQPTDESTLTAEREDEIADGLARAMGCPPEKKAS